MVEEILTTSKQNIFVRLFMGACSYNTYYPRVTIIITTYNRAHLLENAINGALIQNYQNLEIIIADNASSDNTSGIVAKYLSRGNIKYIRHDRNIGSLANHNSALRDYASGEWVIFVSDDDYLDTDTFVTDAIDLIKDYGFEKVAFLQTGFYTLYPDGEKVLGVPRIEKDIDYFKCGQYFLDYFNIRHFSFTTTIFNRDLALKFNIFNDDHYGTDVELMLLMSLYNDVILVKKPYGVYRIHDGQLYGSSEQENLFKMFSTYESVYLHALKLGFDGAAVKKWLNDAQVYHYTCIADNIIYRHNRHYELFLSEAIHNVSLYYSIIQQHKVQIHKQARLRLFLLHHQLKLRHTLHIIYKSLERSFAKMLRGNR